MFNSTFSPLNYVIKKSHNDWMSRAYGRIFREGKHSAGQRRKADPRKKQRRKIRQADKRGNRGK